jgi:hypothetical protein
MKNWPSFKAKANRNSEFILKQATHLKKIIAIIQDFFCEPSLKEKVLYFYLICIFYYFIKIINVHTKDFLSYIYLVKDQ